MKIFAIAGDIPFRCHGDRGVTAVNLVLHALLRELQMRGADISVQCVFAPPRVAPLRPMEEEELRLLAESGMHVLPTLFPNDYRPAPRSARGRTLRLLSRAERLRYFYPAVALRDTLRRRISESQADIILTLWSMEGVAATHGISDIPRVAYHGDPDYLPVLCQVRDRDLFSTPDRDPSPLSALDQRWRVRLHAATHHTLMRDMQIIANVTANNASLYADRGHPDSVYVRNTWPEQPSSPSAHTPHHPFRIIGHMGALGQTGTTYGLQFLLREVLPRLPAAMEGHPYEVHIIGGGDPAPGLRAAFRDAPIIRRGFVEDLDAELALSDAYCLFNNAGPYQAAYTRHLLAWSMRLCLIAHTGSALSIPEITHEHNALLAGTGAEAAQCIARACVDPALNQRLRQGGERTYQSFFKPSRVADGVWACLQRGLAERRARS